MCPRGEMDIIFVFGTKGRGSSPLEGIRVLRTPKAAETPHRIYSGAGQLLPGAQKFCYTENNMKKIFLIIFLGTLLFPSISSAGIYIADGKDVYYDGLVPCGKDVCMKESFSNEEIKILKDSQSLKDTCTAVGGEMYSYWYCSQHPEAKVCTAPEFTIGLPCTFCHFFVMLDEIIDFVLFKLVPPIAILMLVIGGAMFMMASFSEWGGPVTLSQAKKLITSVVIGLIIIFASWLIINLFFQVFGVEQWTGLQQGWFRIDCPIELPNL